MVIFHSYVGLPEDKTYRTNQLDVICPMNSFWKCDWGLMPVGTFQSRHSKEVSGAVDLDRCQPLPNKSVPQFVSQAGL